MLVFSPPRRLQVMWLNSIHSVRRNGRGDGHKMPPQPRGEALSQTEMTLERTYTDRRGRLERKRERQLCAPRLAAIENGLSEDERSFPAIVTATKVNVHEARLRRAGPWRQALDHVAACRKEVDDFKTDNLLTRPAHNPDPMLAIGVGTLVFVVETTANGILFADVSKWGLVGGVINSASLSVPNIALGLTAGFAGLRGCHDIRPAVRWLGTTATAVCLSGALASNFFVGQLRAVAEQRAAHNQPLLPADWHAAAAQMLADPLAPLQSGPALTLVVLGLLVVAVALWDGLDGFSDRVPGYSRLDRRYHRALARVQALKACFFRELDRLIKHAVRTIDHRHRTVHGQLADALGILGRAAGIIIGFNQRLADQLWVHREAVATYRLTNRRARDEADVPDHFHQQPLHAEADTFPAFDWLAMRNKFQSRAGAACSAAQAAIAELQRYRLQVMQEIEAEAAAVTRAPLLMPPLLLTATEYA